MAVLYLGPIYNCITHFGQPDQGGFWITFRTIVAAPICEEVLFRGIILSRLLQHYSTSTSIIFAFLLFSLRKWLFNLRRCKLRFEQRSKQWFKEWAVSVRNDNFRSNPPTRTARIPNLMCVFQLISITYITRSLTMGCRQRSKKLFFDVATPPCSAVCPPFYLCRTITTFSHQSPPTSGATITARCLCQPAGPKRRSALTCWALAYLFWPLRWYSDLWKKMLIFAKKSVNKKREDKFKTNTFFHKIRNLDCYQNFKWRQIRKIVFFLKYCDFRKFVVFENLLFLKIYCFWKFTLLLWFYQKL